MTGLLAAPSVANPVFVLCNGRSGSTLLRFLLDAHPELACPPETNMPSLCAQLATVWSLIEGAPLSANRGDEPPVIPDAAIAGVRATMDTMLGSYLARRGKARYCDKSLGTARLAGLMLRVYPEAKFICLYRHPMDVVASGMEACPFGLNGYGFDPYIAMSPGNIVLALARFWTDSVAVTMAAEEQFPDKCLRVRYEDLVLNPEEQAATIFDFLGIAQVPGISKTCFSGDRERFGPGDHKIWFTSDVSADSIGRGWSMPAGLIGPVVLTQINELAAKLGYLPVDEAWGTSAPPADLRVADSLATPAAAETAELAGPSQSGLLADRLRAGLARTEPVSASRLEPYEKETFVAVWVPDTPGSRAEHWLVDLRGRTVTPTTGAAQERSDWDIIGSSRAWEEVIEGRLNLSAAMRACTLRYCDGDGSGPLASDSRIAILADLLALASW